MSESLKKKVEENVVVWLLGSLTTGFLAGFGAYKTIVDVRPKAARPMEAVEVAEPKTGSPSGRFAEINCKELEEAYQSSCTNAERQQKVAKELRGLAEEAKRLLETKPGDLDIKIQSLFVRSVFLIGAGREGDLNPEDVLEDLDPFDKLFDDDELLFDKEEMAPEQFEEISLGFLSRYIEFLKVTALVIETTVEH